MKHMFSATAALLAAALMLTLAACSGGKKEGPKGEKKEVNYNPAIVFRDLVIRDTITAGDSVDYSFTYFNDGRSDLVLTEAISDWNECPAEFSKNPVPPGGEGKVNIKCAISAPGQTNIQIRVKGNTPQPEIVLIIFCTVLEKK